MFAINIAGCTIIDSFCMWLLQLDWPNFINNIESLYNPFAIGSICAKAKQKIEKAIKILLATRKVV